MSKIELDNGITIHSSDGQTLNKMGRHYQVAHLIENNIANYLESGEESLCSDDLTKRVFEEVYGANLQQGDMVTVTVRSLEGAIRHQTQWVPDPDQDNTHIQTRNELSNNNYARIFQDIQNVIGNYPDLKDDINTAVNYEFDHLLTK